MNILDENVLESQRQLLGRWRVPVRQIGHDVGRKGMADAEIIPFLLTLSRATFFTMDWDYYRQKLVHAEYCLVFLDVSRTEAAAFIRRLLHHSEFDTSLKRMGHVIRVSAMGLVTWQLRVEREARFDWVG
ncbi:MAG: hypothetical protein FJ011_05825 [Chloroflexi bacterium]|nr:hypothetical protein [Chloroflexota bacterium]